MSTIFLETMNSLEICTVQQTGIQMKYKLYSQTDGFFRCKLQNTKSTYRNAKKNIKNYVIRITFR